MIQTRFGTPTRKPETPSALPSPELDGELLAAFRKWQPWDRERQAIDAIYSEFPHSYAPDGRHIADDRFDSGTDQWHALVDEITETPARTMLHRRSAHGGDRAGLAGREGSGMTGRPFRWPLSSSCAGDAKPPR